MTLNKFTGLVIDDDPNILEMCKHRFVTFSFIGALNKSEVNTILQSKKMIHFVLLDYKLGNENGFDLIHFIRKHRVIIPIIVLSAHSTKPVLVEAIQKKPDAFIEKPINFQLLENTINELVLKAYPEKRGNYKIINAIESIRLDFNEYNSKVFDKDLSIYAEEHGVEYKTLSYQFKQHTGETFRQFILNKKLDVAKQLLRTSDLSVVDIASRLGYWNPSSFMKIFKKQFNITPDQYRTSKFV